MFFHIDESGNTGNNLFDENQPRLSYGVLSSKTNADARCIDIHKKALATIDKDIIHANELGAQGLQKIAPHLFEMQKKMRFDFDYYFIEKPTLALVAFFDDVFDSALNEAVRWDTYWTPFRYLIIHKLAFLFDETLLRESWRLSTIKHIEHHTNDIVSLLTELRDRVLVSGLDARSIEIISDAFNYGITNPLNLDFGSTNRKFISPNAVGFQFVVSCIAQRTRAKSRSKILSIIIDRQHQFNAAQIDTHFYQTKIAEGIKNAPEKEKIQYINHPLMSVFNKDQLELKGLSDDELTVSRSVDSIGLQIVDVYLWITNKIISGYELPDELIALWHTFSKRGITDGISMDGMGERFMKFEEQLPPLEGLTEEQLNLARESLDTHREKVSSLLSDK